MKKKICIVSGSRADYGLLEWPIKVLSEDDTFDVWYVDIPALSEHGHTPKQLLDWEFCMANWCLGPERGLPEEMDLVLLLGDREEILKVALDCHLMRIPIAHIAGGDVTEGSYDDAMRDCISRMADIHFVTSTSAMARLTHMGCTNVHLVGNPGIDYIKNADWKKERPINEPYVVVNYQAETIDGTNEIEEIIDSLAGKHAVFILPNPDRGSDDITRIIDHAKTAKDIVHESLPHDEYLNLIYHCDELIGNSSSMLYEAPELEVKTRMIGKRQRGRTIPWGDGLASQRILNILKYTL